MIRAGRGRIINVTSAPLGGIPYIGAYSASKAAQTSLSRTIAGEAQQFGISAFAYFPGVVRTAMLEWAASSPDVQSPLGGIFREMLDGGRDTPIERSTEQLMVIASGRLDALSGRYFHVNDDLDDLLTRTEEIERDNLYTQRRVT